MRRSPSTLLSLCKLSSFNLSTTNLPMLISCILICTALSFAAAPDRITGSIVAQQLIKLSAGVPLKAQSQYDRGPVDPSLKLGYMTLLTVPSASQQKAITKLLAQQQDPRSPLYHKWLTPEQYGDRFGLSPHDIQKITIWIQSQGFTVLSVARGRNWITFSGTAAQAESAFQTQIHNFDVDGEKHFSNTTPPSIPAALSGVVSGIRGLSNFRPKSHAVHSSPDYTLPVTGGYKFFLAPGDIATMYDIGPLYSAGIDGTGQTLAVMGQTDVYLADLNDFRSGFALSAISGCTTNSSDIITACNTTNFKYVLVNSDPGSPSTNDLVEADIDIEWSGAVARNAQIIYVNAPNPSGNGTWDSWYYAVDNNLSPVITLSYGGCELGEAESTGTIGTFSSDETELKKANTEGITFMNSSGDSGAAECDYTTNPAIDGYAVSYPASSPEVTGVGGTLIPYLDYTATYWNTSNSTTGGSAVSYIPEEAWNDAQEFGEFCVANPTNSFCTGHGITSWVTAQSFLGILAGGGGLSNCVTETGGVCATPPSGGFPQPAWQASLAIPGQTTAVRFSPDVSLLASPYWPGYIVCTAADELPGFTGTASTCAPGGATGILNNLNNYGYTFGGTSVATPIFAGIVTLLNQYLVTNNFQGAPGLGNANPSLYQMATYNKSAFHQLTIGSNGVYCSPGTPSNQPAALRCPAAVAPATEGFLGFDASNFDPTTGYNLVNGLGSIDANNLATAWGQLLTASTTTLSPSAAQIVQGQSETFTITVTPPSASGVVSLYNNGSSTALGTATISGGTGTFTTTSLPVGTNSVTGSYVGTNASSTSPAVTVTVTAPTFTLTSTGTTSHTVLAGQTTLAYNFTATPTSSSTFTSAVDFGCTFLPADPTVACSSASIAAGQPQTTVSITITTKGPNTGTGTQLRHRADNRSPWLPLTLPIAGVVMLGLMRGKVSRKVSKRSAIALLCFSLALVGFMLACGGGSSTPVPVSVTVTPSTTVQLYANEAGNAWPASATQQQFSATVNNSTNQSVTWAVTGGSANGAISSSGLYTSPATVPNPATVTVTATAAADTTKSVSGNVDILTPTALGTFTVTVTATEATTSVPATPAPTLTVD